MRKITTEHFVTSTGVEYWRLECDSKIVVIQKVRTGSYKLACHIVNNKGTINPIVPLVDFRGIVYRSTKNDAFKFAKKWLKQK